MPEGPELHIAARFVNTVGSKQTFSGAVVKSEVSTRNPDVNWNEPLYRISATSRGKEVRLTLTAISDSEQTNIANGKTGADGNKPEKKAAKKEGKPTKADVKHITNQPQSLDILFRFGMSGKFRFDPVEEIQKHAHLNFFSSDGKKVLSFVDYRRFGRWEVNSAWGPERGPCVILEYKLFRENVLANLHTAAFNKPICETLLNQKYFNGIGNYLRAEILYRLSIPPFARARDVLEPLAKEAAVKSETPDILALCNILPTEVTNLSGGAGYDPEAEEKDYSEFAAWLQCYYNPNMKNMVDGNKRTIWFTGPAGPLAPSANKSRKRKTKTNLNKKKANEEGEETIESNSPKKNLTRKRLAEKKPKEEPCNQEETKIKAKAPKRKVTNQAKTDTDSNKIKRTKKEEETEINGQKNNAKSKQKNKTTTTTRARRSARVASRESDASM